MFLVLPLSDTKTQAPTTKVESYLCTITTSSPFCWLPEQSFYEQLILDFCLPFD